MLKAIDPCKVAIYIRWSTDDQADGTTLEVQMEGCKAYVLSQGWTVQDHLIFVDDGFSGGKMDRPALTRLRQMIQDRKIDCVVVLKVDRLSRSVVDMVKLVMEEWDGLCYLKSAREAIDTTNHAGRMFFYTLTSFAEWERATIKERTFSGKVKRAQAGKNPGMKSPYGYKTGPDGHFVIVSEEVPVVRRIYDKYRAGMGLHGIAQDLNRDGIPFRNRSYWDKEEVFRILTNRIYVGDLVFGHRTRNDVSRRRVNEPFWIKNNPPLVVASGLVPAIISQDVWEHVQYERSKRPGPKTGQSGRSFSSEYLLSGLLKCSRCGYALSGRIKNAGKNRYYVCSGRADRGITVCDCGNIPADHLEAEVVSLFKSRYGASEERETFLAEYISGLEDEGENLKRQLAKLMVEEERLNEQTARLRRDYRTGKLTIEELREHEAEVRRDVNELQAQKSKLENAIAGVTAALLEERHSLAVTDSLDSWEDLSVSERKAILRHFISSVVAYKKMKTDEVEVKVTWKVGEASQMAQLSTQKPRIAT